MNKELITNFNKLVKQLREEVKPYRMLSDLSYIYEAPAFNALAAMGTSINPILLKELERVYDGPDSLWWEWLFLLGTINPEAHKQIITDDIRGYLGKMTKAWKKWLRQNAKEKEMANKIPSSRLSDSELAIVAIIVLVCGILSHVLYVFGFGVLSFIAGALAIMVFFGALLQM